MWTINPVTKQEEQTFQGELAGQAGPIQVNSKGTEYRIVPVKLPSGVVRSARVYERNYTKGMTIGTSYLCTVTKYADANGVQQFDTVISALTSAARATAADFDFLGNEVAEVATAGAVTAGQI